MTVPNESGLMKSHNYSEQALADMATVQDAISLWRQQNDPADDHGMPLAEFIVVALYKKGRLT